MPTELSDDFEATRRQAVAEMSSDSELGQLSTRWLARASLHRYSYHFNWLGLPIIQFPQDMVALAIATWSESRSTSELPTGRPSKTIRYGAV